MIRIAVASRRSGVAATPVFSVVVTVALLAVLLPPAPARADDSSSAHIERATPLVLPGTPLCVCGSFSDERSRQGLRLDGRPLGPPEAASATQVVFRVPDDLPPGKHTIEGDPAAGFSRRRRVTFTMLRVGGSLARERVRKKETTKLTLVVEGTRDKLEFELINHSPEIATLQGGNRQTAVSSGGSPNRIVRGVTGTDVGRARLEYVLRNVSRCPCEPSDGPPPEDTAEDVVSDTRTPEEILPPSTAEGPCEWVRVRFEGLLAGFPLPDLDALCAAAKDCIDAQKKRRAADAAKKAADAARGRRDRARARESRFNEYLGSDLAGKNQAKFPELGPHYKKVATENRAAREAADKAHADAEAKARQAEADAEAARKKCEAGRAALDAALRALADLRLAWEGAKSDLARCVECERIELLDTRLRDFLRRLREARARCEKEALADLEQQLADARAAQQEADAKAGADAEALENKRKECGEQADQVRAEYEDCYRRALSGTDHATGSRPRGYGNSRTIRVGDGGATLGPVWFRSLGDAARFRRAMNDCLRAKKNGRTTRPNTLSRRRELEKCRREQRRAQRRADRSGSAAGAAAEATRAAEQALEEARGAFAPWDRAEAAIAAWLDGLGEAAKECEYVKKRCDEVREQGEAAVAGIKVPCTPAGLSRAARDAAGRAERARGRMDGLTHAGCAGGRGSAAAAANSAGAVTGENGSAARLRSALAERDRALEEARRLLDEGRCEQARAAYARALRAARSAASHCAAGQRQVRAARSAADSAKKQAAACERRDAELRAAERRRNEARAQQQARAAEARAAAARAAAERRRKQAEDCARKFDRWLKDNLDDEAYAEANKTLETMAQRALDVAVATGTGVAEAAGQAAKGTPSSGAAASGVAAGVLNLGAALFYAWVQSELTDAVVRIGQRFDRKVLSVELSGVRGHCGEIKKGGVTYFWIRVGNKFRVFKISHTRGFEFLGDIKPM